MKMDIYDLTGEVAGEMDLNEKVFGVEVKPHLFWEVVRWQQAKRRAGTHESKTRHFVKGTTTKMYRQKGTGRARHGNAKAPTFVGGGVAHGPHPRKYGFKVNKKVRAGALRSALSMKVNESKMTILESFSMTIPKTREALDVLKRLGAEKRTLVIDNDNEALNRSVRNLEGCKYLDVAGLNVFDLLRYDNVVVTRSAVEAAQERLAR